MNSPSPSRSSLLATAEAASLSLDSAIPADATTTPAAMVATFFLLLLGAVVLPRELLRSIRAILLLLRRFEHDHDRRGRLLELLFDAPDAEAGRDVELHHAVGPSEHGHGPLRLSSYQVSVFVRVENISLDQLIGPQRVPVPGRSTPRPRSTHHRSRTRRSRSRDDPDPDPDHPSLSAAPELRRGAPPRRPRNRPPPARRARPMTVAGALFPAFAPAPPSPSPLAGGAPFADPPRHPRAGRSGPAKTHDGAIVEQGRPEATATDAPISRCRLCGEPVDRSGRRGPAPMHPQCRTRARAAMRLRQAASELEALGEDELAAAIRRHADRLARS